MLYIYTVYITCLHVLLRILMLYLFYIYLIGVDFKLVKVHYNNKVVAVKFWDTAGQER